MNILRNLLIVFLFSFGLSTLAQTTTMVILDQQEISHLRKQVRKNPEAKTLADSILELAHEAIERNPRPLKEVFFEGLLENDSRRIDTKKSFLDIDATVNLIYASYLEKDLKYGKKAIEFAIAWAEAYKATGNPINENKFVAFYWTYHLFKDQLTNDERQLLEGWMREIVTAELARERTPNNNWQAKRLKMIGIIGCILGDQDYQQFSINGFKEYISTAYFADGTSKDLKQRDALHYHVSGIKPSLSVFINLRKFNPEFDLYEYVGEQGGSIQRSLEYTVPYATGELKRKEWVNTTVKLDKERAAAGLADYQPGMLFDPEYAKPTFEWGVFYNADWYNILSDEGEFTSTWVGLLNSPWIRK